MAIDSITRQAVYEAYNGKCFYTGRELGDGDYEVDHVLPRAKGGTDDVGNLVLCAKDVNRSKSAKVDYAGIEPILYIVRTVYAPRVASIYGRLKKDKPFSVDVLCQNTKEITQKSYDTVSKDVCGIYSNPPLFVRDGVGEYEYKNILSTDAFEYYSICNKCVGIDIDKLRRFFSCLLKIHIQNGGNSRFVGPIDSKKKMLRIFTTHMGIISALKNVIYFCKESMQYGFIVSSFDIENFTSRGKERFSISFSTEYNNPIGLLRCLYGESQPFGRVGEQAQADFDKFVIGCYSDDGRHPAQIRRNVPCVYKTCFSGESIL